MSPLFVYIVLLLVYTSVVSGSVYQNELTTEDNQCTQYLAITGIILHCASEKVRVEVNFDSMVDLLCEDGIDIDPYQYISMINHDSVTGLTLNIRSCPPPERNFSQISIRVKGQLVGIGDLNVPLGIKIDCGGLKSYSLNSNHFTDLPNLSDLSINCQALSEIPNVLLSGECNEFYYFDVKNTALTSIHDAAVSIATSIVSIVVTGNKLAGMFSLHTFVELEVLDISNNEIIRLEYDAFKETSNIRKLNISLNHLSYLPSSLVNLKKLRLLEAQGNRLIYICPRCISGISYLKRINLEGNLLQYVDVDMAREKANVNSSLVSTTSRPDGIALFSIFSGKITEFLSLRRNDLASIPENLISGLGELRQFDVSFNRLSSIPPKLLRNNIRLHAFKASNNRLANVSEGTLEKTPWLQHLDLSNNRIETLGNRFFSTPIRLEYIDLSENSIATLPNDIFHPFEAEKFETMELVLNLEGNRLVSIPNLTLRRLTELKLARNSLTHLKPDTLAQVPSLKQIDLSHNQFQTVNQPIRYRSASYDQLFNSNSTDLFHSQLVNLTHVDLSHNLLKSFPIIHRVHLSLENLNLNGNKINDFAFTTYEHDTDSFLNFETLESLDLSHNSLGKAFTLEEKPPRILHHGRMRRLKYLDLSWNNLTFSNCLEGRPLTIPRQCDSFLVDMWRLKELNLSHNEITMVPEFFRDLQKLRKVDFSHNKIKLISFDNLFFVNGITWEELEKLGELSSGYLRKNDYLELPNSHHLTVDLRYNEISEFDLPKDKVEMVRGPEGLHRFFARATLLLGHNPISCGCQTFKLLRYWQQEIRPVAEEETWGGQRLMLPAAIDIHGLSCSEPASMQQMNLSDSEAWTQHLLPLAGLCLLQGYDLGPT